MQISRLQNAFRQALVGLAVCAWCGLLADCAPVVGYPKDPEDTDATLVTLAPYFNGSKEADYVNTDPTNVVLRKQKRDVIILERIHAYNIEFADFERRLYGDGNEVSLGSDLVGLVLGGLIATTGNAATKSALGAASIGVSGANTAINKDLYYQKTIPALLAQMEADRLKALAPIAAGLKLSDADYPLMQAYIDLDAYKTDGSIPGAINAVNQSAGNAKDDAQAVITLQRASAVDQLKGIQTVQAQLKSLTTDAQYLALARAMQVYLSSRSPALQQVINQLDPKALRLSASAKKARQIMNIWIENDDVSTSNQQQWLTAIAVASTAK